MKAGVEALGQAAEGEAQLPLAWCYPDYGRQPTVSPRPRSFCRRVPGVGHRELVCLPD
jgi:hypothetical protein